MRAIPQKHRTIINTDPYFRICARKDNDCSGRMTIEHALTYARRQISEMWNYIPLCWYHHLGKGLDKRVNRQIAVSRATAEDRLKYPKLDWFKYE